MILKLNELLLYKLKHIKLNINLELNSEPNTFLNQYRVLLVPLGEVDEPLFFSYHLSRVLLQIMHHELVEVIAVGAWAHIAARVVQI
jgi:hypothetical protein